MRWHRIFFVTLFLTTSLQSTSTIVCMPLAQDDSNESEEEVESQDESTPSFETEGSQNNAIGTRGNWIKKKDWLLKSFEVSDDIYKSANQVQATREVFYKKYNVADKEIDEFYSKVGFEQGKLTALFENIKNYLTKKKKKEIAKLNEEKDQKILSNRDHLIKMEIIDEDLKKELTKLEQLKLDMKSIEDLDKSLAIRLKKLDNHIEQAMQLTIQAQKKTDQTWHVIDHVKARSIYFDLKNNILQKIKSTESFIKNVLLQDFENVLNTIKTQIAKVKDSIILFEKMGIIIEHRTQRVAALKKQKIAEQESQKAAVASSKVKKSVKTKKRVSWYARSYNTVASGLKSILSLLTSPFQWLFKSKSNQKIKTQQKATQVKPTLSTTTKKENLSKTEEEEERAKSVHSVVTPPLPSTTQMPPALQKKLIDVLPMPQALPAAMPHA